jgi:hypothetical protein
MKHNIFQYGLRSVALAFCLTVWLHAGADELDDQVKQACAGLSARFNSSGTKSDAMDDEIGKAIDSNADLRALVTRARFTGSAHACGSDTKAAETKLDATAATIFAGSAPKTKRLVQILHCTQARNVREAASHWGSQQFCTQAVRNFDNYVTHDQPPP